MPESELAMNSAEGVMCASVMNEIRRLFIISCVGFAMLFVFIAILVLCLKLKKRNSMEEGYHRTPDIESNSNSCHGML